MSRIADEAEVTAGIILGGGMIKHSLLRANQSRGGFDYLVVINDAHPFDGSESGADIERDILMKRVKRDAKRVKLTAECTLVFPLIVKKTFYEFQNSQ